jgi:cellulose synthase/poly-beta-1,6-N-acetylglucosamine synthase-like glycosyltransferase
LPAVKRNIGIKIANGEYIAFIDSDAYPIQDWLNNAIPFFSDQSIGLVGGPSLTPPNDNALRQASGAILASKIGGGELSKRYVIGKPTNVDDMPSSNMIIKKSFIEKLGGFNANYWPGEDTYFCMQIKKDFQKKILYSPLVAVYHHRRTLFRPHLKQIWSYGLHRGYFAKKFPYNSRHPKYFIPSIFVLLNAVGVPFSAVFVDVLISYVTILSLYFVMCVATGLSTKKPKVGVLVIIGIPLTHFVYGLGFLKGLLSELHH